MKVCEFQVNVDFPTNLVLFPGDISPGSHSASHRIIRFFQWVPEMGKKNIYSCRIHLFLVENQAIFFPATAGFILFFFLSKKPNAHEPQEEEKSLFSKLMDF